MNSSECSTELGLYADLREKWKHEDDLINQRVTWLLATQGFLFPAFGVIAKLRLDLHVEGLMADGLKNRSEFWLFSISEAIIIVSSLAVTYYLRHGIFAAIRAMNGIKSQLFEHQLAGRIPVYMNVDVLDETSASGTSPARGMVNTFAGVWFGIYFYEVFRLASIAAIDRPLVLAVLVLGGSLVLGYRYLVVKRTSASHRPPLGAEA